MHQEVWDGLVCHSEVLVQVLDDLPKDCCSHSRPAIEIELKASWRQNSFSAPLWLRCDHVYLDRATLELTVELDERVCHAWELASEAA